MNKNKFAPRGYPMVVSFVLIALLVSACQGGAAPAAKSDNACSGTYDGVGYSLAPGMALTDTETGKNVVENRDGECIILVPEAGSITIGEPASAALPVGLLVTALQWTPWDLNNLVIPSATVVRPTKPFEGQVPMPVVSSMIYQLKTDMDDTNPAGTWKPGSLVYEFDIPNGWQPQYLGAQGDTSVSLCWQREEKDGNSSTLETQVLLKTQNGNGASALVSFLPVSASNVPPVGQRCAASK